MNKFLDTCTAVESDNLNGAKMITEIEAITKSPLIKNSPRSDGFTTKFYQTFKDKLKPVVHNLFHKMEMGVNLSSSFYEVRISQIPKTG